MNKYLRAVSSNYFFFFINTVFFLVITSLAVKIMGEDLFGVWSILNSILIFSGVGMLGMGGVINKFASEENPDPASPADIISSAGVILLPISLLVMLGLLFSRGWIAAQFQLSAQLEEQFNSAMIFTAISIIPGFFGRIPQGYLLSQLRNTLARSVEVGGNILTWAGAVYLAYRGAELMWMTLWGFVVSLVSAVILFAALYASVGFHWRIKLSLIKRMTGFSGYSFIESFAIVLFQHFDRILVGWVLGPAAAGVYAIGTSVGLRITMVAGQASEVMLPYASLANSRNDHEKLYRTFRKLMSYVSLMVAVLSVFLLLWIPEILKVWISPAFAEQNALMFRIIILFYGLLTLCHPGRQTLVGVGKIKFVALVYLTASILLLVALYFFSLWFGMIGPALANGVMVILLLFTVFAYKSLQPRNYFFDFLKDNWIGFFFPIIAFVAIWFTENIVFKIGLSIFMVGIFSLYGFLFFRKSS